MSGATIKAYAEIAGAILSRTDLTQREKDMICTAEERAQESWAIATRAVALRFETYDQLQSALRTIETLKRGNTDGNS